MEFQIVPPQCTEDAAVASAAAFLPHFSAIIRRFPHAVHSRFDSSYFPPSSLDRRGLFCARAKRQRRRSARHRHRPERRRNSQRRGPLDQPGERIRPHCCYQFARRVRVLKRPIQHIPHQNLCRWLCSAEPDARYSISSRNQSQTGAPNRRRIPDCDGGVNRRPGRNRPHVPHRC